MNTLSNNTELIQLIIHYSIQPQKKTSLSIPIVRSLKQVFF